MNDDFDPRHDAAIRAVLRETVERTGPRRTGRRPGVVLALVLAGLLALGGGGYAVAAAYPEIFRLAPAAAPAATSSSAPTRERTPTGSAITATPTPRPTTVAPSAPTTSAAEAIATPVITEPAQGQRFTGPARVTIAGTGTPGTHVFLAEYCTLAPPACTEPAELGQPWQTPIVVGADGRWSTVTTVSPPQTLSFRITASAARTDRTGAALPGGSGQSAPVVFTVTAAG
jgi:hypothetical protein